ncbi:aminotransferase class V-fold PLP-dependent enzyme [bacterium]|nr:MAG: aminotransferase class V-fold PLP-dependent enzyme [bacterium]
MTDKSIETSIKAFREDLVFPAQGRIYLNHAAISPISNYVKKAMDSDIQTRFESDPENLEALLFKMEQSRKILARWMNITDFNRIGFVYNVSTTINQIVQSMEWHSGDEILVNSKEFPSNRRPYETLKTLGVQILELGNSEGAVRAEEVEQLITPKTKLVAISAVQFLGGFKANLTAIAEICRKHQVLLLVDTIQALGQISFNQEEIHADFIVGGSHKWLMGPTGIGYCFISENGESAMKVKPQGWLNNDTPWNLFASEATLLKGGRILEVGGISSINVSGLYATLRQFDAIGIDHIQVYAYQNAGNLRARLAKTGAVFGDFKLEERSSIMSLYFGKRAEDIHKKLKENQIDTAVREGFIRLSPHFYLNDAEIHKAADVLLSVI